MCCHLAQVWSKLSGEEKRKKDAFLSGEQRASRALLSMVEREREREREREDYSTQNVPYLLSHLHYCHYWNQSLK